MDYFFGAAGVTAGIVGAAGAFLAGLAPMASKMGSMDGFALAVLRAVRDQAVLILGARQVGKTTLARAAFPKAAYCDLEDPTLRHLFTEEPVFQRKFQEKKKQKP